MQFTCKSRPFDAKAPVLSGQGEAKGRKPRAVKAKETAKETICKQMALLRKLLRHNVFKNHANLDRLRDPP